jgi:hypothetical protein
MKSASRIGNFHLPPKSWHEDRADCLIAASLRYPGGSPKDPNSVGFHWSENYISDLFDHKAVNGKENRASPLAMLGVARVRRIYWLEEQVEKTSPLVCGRCSSP